MRSENGYGFLRPGLKTGVGNSIFGSEIGSGLKDAGGTPPPKISMSTPPGSLMEEEGLSQYRPHASGIWYQATLH